MSDTKKILEIIKDKDIQFVDLRFTDPRGKMQHVSQHVSTIDEDSLKEGFMFDGSSIAGWKAINESDMKLMPDCSRSVIDPFYSQPTMAIFCDVFKNLLSSFLTKWLPENERDLIAKPKYLYPEAILNSTIAINLITQEQSRLLAMMPDYLNILRENNKESYTQSERHEGYMTLCKNIKNFSDEVITLNPQNEMADLLKIQSKNESIESLLITLQNFVSTVNELNIKQLTLSNSIVESLHMILTLLQESQSSSEDNEMLENLTSDKGALMDKIRDQLLENKKLSSQEQKSLFLLTRIFERLIWQIRKHSLMK